jgi:hypothetical protein
MKYLTGLTEKQAKSISKELYTMSIGTLIERSISQYLLGWIKHPECEEWALVVPDVVKIPLVVCDDIEKSIATLLAMFDAEMTEEEKSELPELVRYRKTLELHEQYILLGEIMPQGIKASAENTRANGSR